jgi:hypothetical protein
MVTYNGRKVGFHSGTLYAKNIQVQDTMTINGSMTFGDASADTLTVTGTASFGQTITSTYAGKAFKSGTSGTPITISTAGSGFDIYERVSATSGTHRGMIVDVVLSGASISTSNYTIRGHCQLLSNTVAGASYLAGVQGKFTLGGGTINHADSRTCALLAQLDISSGTYTAGQISALWVDCGSSGNMGTGDGQFNVVRISNTTTTVPNAVMYVYSKGSYLFDLGAPSSTADWIASGAVGGSQNMKLKINLNGTPYYIPCNTA